MGMQLFNSPALLSRAPLGRTTSTDLMTRILPVTAFGAALLSAWAITGVSDRRDDVRILEMKAVLYHEESASLDTFDVMQEGPEAPSLWNTSVGEGAAGGNPSNATLVLVRVDGPRGRPWNATLHVVAKADWPTRG